MLTTQQKTFLGLLIFTAFALFIEYYIGWLSLLKPWWSIAPLSLALALLLLLISYALRSLRLCFFFHRELRGSFPLTLRLMLQHNLSNNLLPMRSGELAFPLLMKHYFAIPAIRSLPALLWFRVLDLHTLGLLALPTIVVPTLGALWAVTLCAAWLVLPWVLFRWGTASEAWLAQRDQQRLTELAHRFAQGLPRTYGLFLGSWWWTLVNWIVKLGVFVWILQLFVELDALPALLGVIGGEVTSVLPVHSLAGMGTYEAGIMAALLPWGIDTKSALHGAVNLHLFLLAASLLGGMVTWLLPRTRQ